LRVVRFLPVLVLCLSARAAAQTAPDSGSAAPSVASPVVQSVEIYRRDIFDPNERSWYAKVANALHVQTRPRVIERELLFRPGEPYDSALVAESERNLRSLGLFRRVQIDSVHTDSGVRMRVETKDGWSTRADWRFRSVGSDIEFTIGLIEDNLLGTATLAGVRYRKTVDRTSVELGFRQPRLFAGRVGLAAAYENRSDGEVAAMAIEQPFFSLNSRFAFRVEGDDRDERILRFFNGEDDASDSLSRRYTLGRAGVAWALRASPQGFLRLGIAGQVVRDDYLPREVSGDFPRTVTGAIGSYLVWKKADFLVTQGVSGFGRKEDIDLGTTIRVGVNLAPEAFGYDQNGIGPLVVARTGARIPGGFSYFEGLAGGLYNSAGLDSGAVQLAATAVVKPLAGHVAVAHVEGGWLKDPLPGQEFDLGLNAGPRAFRSHAFTGDRMVFATAEYRITVVDDFLGLAGLGVAGFVDHGGAWYSGAPSRFGWDTGLGLRLGATRAATTEALRFDLAYRFENDAQGAGWVLTIGKGFVFSQIGKRGYGYYN
jgi:Omp85 superfamily domain